MLETMEFNLELVSDDEYGTHNVQFDVNRFDEDEQGEILALNVGDSVAFSRGLDDLKVTRVA